MKTEENVFNGTVLHGQALPAMILTERNRESTFLESIGVFPEVGGQSHAIDVCSFCKTGSVNKRNPILVTLMDDGWEKDTILVGACKRHVPKMLAQMQKRLEFHHGVKS